MGNTILVELKNDNALNLLYDLERMDILHIVREEAPEKIKLSEKLKGLLTKEQGLDLKKHVESIRQEWNDTL
jgi:hypothetical protein